MFPFSANRYCILAYIYPFVPITFRQSFPEDPFRWNPCCKLLLFYRFFFVWFGLIWFGWVLWHTNHCRSFDAKSSLYICIKYIWFGWFCFYSISTIVGYLTPNLLYTYILDIWIVLFGFLSIPTIVSYLMPNPLYTYILDIWFLFGFYGIPTIVGYLMPNPLYTCILDIWFVLFGFYDISTIVGYLMLNSLFTYMYWIYMIWCGWVLLHVNHYRLFNAKSSLYIYAKYMICQQILLITFLNEPELIFCTVKWFQVFLFNSNNSIYY